MSRSESGTQRQRLKKLDSIYTAIEEALHQQGLKALTPADRHFYYAFATLGLVGNGGFQRFFEGSTDPETAAMAFEAIGSSAAAGAVAKAISVFPRSKPMYGYWERMEFLSELNDAKRAAIEVADDHFFGEMEDIEKRLFDYAHTSGLLASWIT